MKDGENLGQLVETLASESNTATGEYVQHLVESHIEHDAWFRTKVTASLAKLDEGQFVSHEDVGQRLKALLKPE